MFTNLNKSPANSTINCIKMITINKPAHLRHVATLPCYLALITMRASDIFASFPMLMFHKV